MSASRRLPVVSADERRHSFGTLPREARRPLDVRTVAIVPALDEPGWWDACEEFGDALVEAAAAAGANCARRIAGLSGSALGSPWGGLAEDDGSADDPDADFDRRLVETESDLVGRADLLVMVGVAVVQRRHPWLTVLLTAGSSRARWSTDVRAIAADVDVTLAEGRPVYAEHLGRLAARRD